VHAVLAAVALTVACGRIGYEELAPNGDAGRPPLPGGMDGSSGGSANADAAGEGEASFEDVSVDAPPDVAEVDTAPGGDAADESPDVGADAAPDAAEVGPPACSVAASAISDYCAAVPYLPEPPVIDGTVDCGLPLLALTPVGWSGPGTPDATATYAVAWRPDGLYFFVDVTDPSLVPAESTELTWQGDAVELYMDSDGVYAAPPAYDNPGTRQFTVAAPPTAQSSVARAQIWYTGSVNGADWTSTQFRAFGTPTGYVVEAFVTGPDLGLSTLSLAAGGQVGMDLSIDVSYPTDQGPDAGGPGNRIGQYYLHVAAPDAGGGIPPFDPRAFCVPALAAP
jgi:hypothetical protein